jgi:hypothetical protein
VSGRLPLVYATSGVLAVAVEDGYRGVVENDVAAALADGRLVREPLGDVPPLRGDAFEVVLRGGWRARVAPDRSPGGHECFLVLRVSRERPGRWRAADGERVEAAAVAGAGRPSAAREREGAARR